MENHATIPLIVVTAVATVAGVIDLRSFRVPNLLTVPLLITGLIYNVAANGLAGLQTSLLGALFGFGVLVFLYILGAMGAGDVKLLAGVGAWLGFWGTFYVFIVAALATGLCSLAMVVWQGGLGRAFTSIYIALYQAAALTRHLGAEERVEAAVKRSDRRRRLIPFAAMVALGVVFVLVYSQWFGPKH